MTAVENLITDNLPIWSSSVQSKSSSGHGTGSKRTLYGVKKLRELILDLAVRGLLVPQDPDDEPANLLFERISAEKRALVKAGKIKNLKSLIPPTASEYPHPLPSSWEWVRLGEVTNYGMSDKIAPQNAEDNTWVLELEDVEKETSKLLAKVRFSQRVFKSSKSIFKRGDVIYGKLRPYLDKVIVADEDGVCTTEMIPLRGHLDINPQYLRIVMKSPRFKEYANNSTHGMNLPRIGTTKARLALIPICAVLEQHRIVAKVDELMALCDTLEQQQEDSIQAHEVLVEALLEALTSAADADAFQAAWQRISEHFDLLFTTKHSIDKLKETILQLAVMGKLVPQDPSDGPASLLLEKIAIQRQLMITKGECKKLSKDFQADMIPPALSLPINWQWSQVYECAILRSGVSFPADRELNEGSYLYCKVGDMNMVGNEKELRTSSRFVNSTEKELLSAIPPNSIAFPKRGGAIATNKKRYINELLFVDLNIMTLTPILPLSVNYFMTWLNSFDLASLNSGTSVPQINNKDIGPLFVPIPPLLEQHRIVAKVDELMDLCDQLKEVIQQAQQTQIHLTDAVVENAL